MKPSVRNQNGIASSCVRASGIQRERDPSELSLYWWCGIYWLFCGIKGRVWSGQLFAFLLSLWKRHFFQTTIYKPCATEVAWQMTALMSRIVSFYGGGLCAVTPQKSIFCLGLVLDFWSDSMNHIDAESQSVALWAMRFMECHMKPKYKTELYFGGTKLVHLWWKVDFIENAYNYDHLYFFHLVQHHS